MAGGRVARRPVVRRLRSARFSDSTLFHLPRPRLRWSRHGTISLAVGRRPRCVDATGVRTAVECPVNSRSSGWEILPFERPLRIRAQAAVLADETGGCLRVAAQLPVEPGGGHLRRGTTIGFAVGAAVPDR